MKRFVVLALLVGVGIFAGTMAINPAIAHCGTCGVGDEHPTKEQPCPECEKMEDGEKCPSCEAKKKEEHPHDH